MEDIDRIDQMMALLRAMKSNKKKLAKLSDIDCTTLTPKAANKRSADADWLGMDIIRQQHQLHALAVELGFADRRDRYDQIELRDGWHRYHFQPPEPFSA
ncbi:MAG: hypothetical protein ABGX84_06625 [Alcanivorax sp.]